MSEKMHEHCICQYTGIYQFVSNFVSVSVCRSYVMSYCALGRAYIGPSVNTSVLPLVVYPSTYITIRHSTVIFVAL